jgi:hypothetical protein
MNAWDRQAQETSPAYEAFLCYRELRSCVKVGQTLGKSHTLIEGWCSKWSWVDRCRAYDNAIQGAEFEERRAQIKAMQKKHLQTADTLQKKALEAIGKLDMEELPPKVLLEYLKLGVELERRTNYEQMADSEIKQEYSAEYVGFNPLSHVLLKSLADERKAKALKGRADEDMQIDVQIVDDVGGKQYDYSKLTPEESAQLRALSEKALVYTEI